MKSLQAHRKTIAWAIALVLLATAWVFAYKLDVPWAFEPGGDNHTVETAFEQQQSGIWVEESGKVAQLLRDDNKGSRHQRFILQLKSGHTLMIAHNIDLVSRVPLVAGDRVALRGRYEWNHKGGVVHWTHHDPAGKVDGGWIDHKGERYR